MEAVIHWFRRDLRLTDNTALNAALERRGAALVPAYIVSLWEGSHRWTGPLRQAFLCGCLKSLSANLEALGSSLTVRSGDPVEELLRLAKECGARTITFNRDPDPHGRKTEARLVAAAAEVGIDALGYKDVCIHERDEVRTGAGEPFRVFTPYLRAWTKIAKPQVTGKPAKLLPCPAVPGMPLPTLETWGLSGKVEEIPEAGERAARQRMKEFVQRGIASYGSGRDLPGGSFTSRLSQDLRFGLISIRELYARCSEAALALPAVGRDSANKFIAELVWREFYMQVLWHFPQVLEEEFNPKLRGMAWDGDVGFFDAWREGQTGFPIVDAAMRQLRQTGFMHNRARMITAMFLTKDLQLDWRLGEGWFMQMLVDGEIASNNGGWQWSAGTGADAAPYFRIQNPWTQTRRYDPEGTYIRRWVPELAGLPAWSFYDPPEPGFRLAKGYPRPIVDHAIAREKTLAMFARQSAAGAA
jgi:deoxyribodipyrimidine photo-lyase